MVAFRGPPKNSPPRDNTPGRVVARNSPPRAEVPGTPGRQAPNRQASPLHARPAPAVQRQSSQPNFRHASPASNFRNASPAGNFRNASPLVVPRQSPRALSPPKDSPKIPVKATSPRAEEKPKFSARCASPPKEAPKANVKPRPTSPQGAALAAQKFAEAKGTPRPAFAYQQSPRLQPRQTSPSA